MINDKYDILELLSDLLGADTLAEELIEILPERDTINALEKIAKKYDVDLNGASDFLYLDDDDDDE